jgi:hypothetical protein
MIGRQARPCMNIFGMYRSFGVVPQGFVVLFPVVLVVIFGALSWWFSRCVFGTLFLGFDGGNSCEPFVVLLPLIPLPNPGSILVFSEFSS